MSRPAEVLSFLQSHGAAMNFASLQFVLFITAFTAFFLALGRTRLFTPFLLVASYIFYGYWDYRFCSLLAVTTAIDYWCGLRVADARSRAEAKIYLLISIGSNLAILFFFKYFNFFVDSAHVALSGLGFDVGRTALEVILPVGISFYTFQNLSYTIDVYAGELRAERSFIKYATFVAFFPQLVAGPIVRARDLLPQISQGTPKPTFAMQFAGLEKVVWGYFLKLGLADNAAAVVDARFAQPEFFNSLHHVIGLICFSLQIYGDFAGYSLIAIGLSQMFGYTLCPNFARPYFASGMRDFWRRWHISLSTWFRDYVYVPLGGNRSQWLRLRNVTITMVISGLWHGAAWTFVLWGAMHAALMLGEDALRWLGRRSGIRLPAPVQAMGRLALIPVVFLLVTLTWLPFRAEGMHTVTTVLSIIAQGDFSLPAGLQQVSTLVRVAVVGAVVFLVDAAIEAGAARGWVRTSVVARGFACSSLVVLLLLLGNFDNRSFIYFQF